MSYVAVAIGGAAVVGYVGSQDASKRAVDAQNNASNRASEYNEQGYQRGAELLNPYIKDGQAAYDKLKSGDFQLDPGYQFRLSEGQKAINNAASARGMYGSGAAMKQLARYRQDYASGEYQNAWNRQNTLANYGFNASQSLANNASGFASNASNNAISMGNAQAANQIASSNNFNNTLNGLAQAGATYYGRSNSPSFNQTPYQYESPNAQLNYSFQGGR